MKSEHKFIVKKVKLGKDDKKLSNDHESQIVDPFSQLWEYNNTISQYNNNNNNNNINNSNNNNNKPIPYRNKVMVSYSSNTWLTNNAAFPNSKQIQGYGIVCVSIDLEAITFMV